MQSCVAQVVGHSIDRVNSRSRVSQPLSIVRNIALIEEMLQLLGTKPFCFLCKQIFLRQLPVVVRTQLVNADFSDPRAVALTATNLWQATQLDRNLLSSATQPSQSVRHTAQPDKLNNTKTGLCFYHQRFGKTARRCIKPCAFSGNTQAAVSKFAVNSVADGSTLLFASDIPSGRSFLIDAGAEVSVTPAGPADRKNHNGPALIAANGTRINTYGTRKINFHIGTLGSSFWQTFRAHSLVLIFCELTL